MGRLGFEPGDLVLLLGHERAEALEFRLVAFGLGGADRLARGVAFGQSVLGGLDPGAAGLVEAEDRLRQRLQPAPRQTLVEGVRCLADRADVVHGGSPGGSRRLCRIAARDQRRIPPPGPVGASEPVAFPARPTQRTGR